jgi:uncharacterized membrane protein
MSLDTGLLPLFAALALASYACRAAGFALMRFVALTPRVKAALDAAPLAVMIGIVAPAAARGGPPEWLALVVTGVVMRLTGNDLGAAMAGVVTVALARAAWPAS